MPEDAAKTITAVGSVDTAPDQSTPCMPPDATQFPDQTSKPAPRTWRQIVGLLVGFALGVLGTLMLSREVVLPYLTPIDSSAPQGSLKLVVIVVLLGLLHLAGGISRQRLLAKSAATSSSTRPKLRRQSNRAGWSLLKYELFLVTMLAYTFQSHWDQQSIGMTSEWPIAVSMIVGFVLYIAFVVLMTLAFSWTGRLGSVEDNNLRVMALLWPRGRRQRAGVIIALCLLNPFVEEMLFRGVLVHQLAVAANALPFALLLGLVVNLGNHAYQGPLALGTHLLVYLITVSLLYSPTGLWGSMGFHFGADLIPTLMIKSDLGRFVARHRARRRVGE